MKKWISFLLIAAMMLTMAACSSATETPSEAASSKAAETASSETASSDAASSQIMQSSETESSDSESGSEVIPEDKEFDLTQEKFIEAIDEYLKKENVAQLSSLKPTKETKNWPGAGIADCYTYALGKSGILALYTDKSNKNIVAFSYVYGNKDNATDLKKVDPQYYYCVIKTISFMADEEANNVGSELKPYNISQDDMETVTTEYCNFSYVVNKGLAMLSITPNN